MSIRARVEDAMFLWGNGRQEGAFLSALVAVAATSRRRFPDRKAVSDREAFERFISAAHTVRLSVEYRGEVHPIEHVLYKWLRCELVHEGEVPVDIAFMPDHDPGALSVRAGGAPEFVLMLSHGWLQHLVGAVVGAPENGTLSRSPWP
jgi:hypothetical protein